MNAPTFTTEQVFALLSRVSRRGKWKLHGVFPTRQVAWDASAALPKNRPHVWITGAATAHTNTKPDEDRS